MFMGANNDRTADWITNQSISTSPSYGFSFFFPYSTHDLNSLQKHLDLTKDVMLRVYIKLDKGDSAPLEIVFASLKARRLLELGLHIPQEMFRHLQGLQSHSLVTLKRLSLLQTTEPGRHCNRSTSSPETIPNLREAALLMLPTILSPRPLDNLSISLPGDIKEKDLLLLRHLCNLIGLLIYSHDDDVPLNIADYPFNIELRCLKKLKVHHSSFLEIRNFLCPALEDLDIVDPHPRQVCSFLKQGSICSLVNLTLQSRHISNEIVNTFRLLPSLSSLQIIVTEFPDIFTLLTRLSSSLRGRLCLLPRLGVLDISMDCCWKWSDNELPLVQFLSARWNVPDVLFKTMVFQWKSVVYDTSQPENISQYIPTCIEELLDRGGHRRQSITTPADGMVHRRLLFLY